MMISKKIISVLLVYAFFCVPAYAATYVHCQTIYDQTCTQENEDWIFVYHICVSKVDAPRNNCFDMGYSAAKQYISDNGLIVTRSLDQVRRIAAQMAYEDEHPDKKAVARNLKKIIADKAEQKKAHDAEGSKAAFVYPEQQPVKP